MKQAIIYAAILLIFLAAGCSGGQPDTTPASLSSQPAPPLQTAPAGTAREPEPLPKAAAEPSPETPSWKPGGIAVAGTYADADVIDIGDGKFRMYYSAEPEVAGFKGQVYSATSSDGVSWNAEKAERMTWATFPSVTKLSDGKYRMYFQNGGKIKSATSSDGLSWKEEAGIRMDTSNTAGLALENVAAPSVMKAGDSYLMAYRGTINKAYPAKVPNDNTQLFLWAASKDGVAFEKKGIALDSRNTIFQGLLDGPELVSWDDGSVRLYFWGYKGIYHVTFDGSSFSQEPVLDFTTATDPRMNFPENPPGDPALAKINGTWLMYYGQHTEGIFYATLS